MSKAKDTAIMKQTIICVQCMKAIDVRPSDVLRFNATAWPECCGKSMKYDLPAPPPSTPLSLVSPLSTD
jgi:hypothetical protein